MPPAKRNNMMAALNEDVIFEIILRLPLKQAIQCTILNKNMHRLISQRKNSLISSSYPSIKSTIFYHHRDNIFKRFTPPNRELSITLPDSTPTDPLIMDSCNGLLLIAFPSERLTCVFNPITGRTTFLSPRIGPFKIKTNTAKLAVDLDDNSTGFHFKLVTVDKSIKSVSGGYFGDDVTWIISVLVPSLGPSGLTRWSVNPVKTVGSSNYYEPVYVHGCMYWPQRGQGNIVFLHVKDEKTGTISWPFSSDSAFLCGSVVDGSLQSVGQLGDEIDINWYDGSKDEWRLKHRIVNCVPNSRVESFDGQRLLIVQGRVTRRARCRAPPPGKEDIIHSEKRAMVHDVLSNKLEWITGSEGLRYVNDKTFFSFVPTLAKVPDKTEFSGFFEWDEVSSALQGIQRLITQGPME